MSVEDFGCIKNPGSAQKIKKSGWRSFKPVITDKCTGCTLCTQYCPEGIIKINKKTKKAEIDYDFCKGCLICVNMCPSRAIEGRREK